MDDFLHIPTQPLTEFQMKKMINELQLENIALRDLLKQMLIVAENCDEDGYAEGVGFVDINMLHEKVRVTLALKETQP